VALVLLLLTLLSMTKVEDWNATGLVSLTLIIVVIIKLFGIAIAYSDLVKRSSSSILQYIKSKKRFIVRVK